MVYALKALYFLLAFLQAPSIHACFLIYTVDTLHHRHALLQINPMPWLFAPDLANERF